MHAQLCGFAAAHDAHECGHHLRRAALALALARVCRAVRVRYEARPVVVGWCRRRRRCRRGLGHRWGRRRRGL
eukprot:2134983-Prymnesium_polylepis.1